MNKYLTSAYNDFSFTSKGKMQRSNWCEYNIDKSKSLLVKLASFTGNKLDANLLVTYYNKPDVITLNNAEKRTFNIKQDELNEEAIQQDRARQSQNSDRNDTSNNAEPNKPTEPTKPSQPEKPTETVDLDNLAEPEKPTEPTKPAEPTRVIIVFMKPV